jgi:hypothetical protein
VALSINNAIAGIFLGNLDLMLYSQCFIFSAFIPSFISSWALSNSSSLDYIPGPEKNETFFLNVYIAKDGGGAFL